MCISGQRTIHESIGKLFVFNWISRSELMTMLREMSVAFPDVGKRHEESFYHAFNSLPNT